MVRSPMAPNTCLRLQIKIHGDAGGVGGVNCTKPGVGVLHLPLCLPSQHLSLLLLPLAPSMPSQALDAADLSRPGYQLSPPGLPWPPLAFPPRPASGSSPWPWCSATPPAAPVLRPELGSCSLGRKEGKVCSYFPGGQLGLCPPLCCTNSQHWNLAFWGCLENLPGEHSK